jgi:L-ascorbate metabolism protein UlaG (beta-lactamase superfamily)
MIPIKIKKLGHCCLLIKTSGLTILTDSGNFSTEQDVVTGIDLVLITHEHADHLHVDSLKSVLKNNPKAEVITNTSVGKILDAENIKYKIVENGQVFDFSEILIESFDGKHEEIFEDFGQVQNTGYFIGDRLFYPGDSFIDPQKHVDVLALPVAGPWCKIGDAITYALKLKPKNVFPVHDGMLVRERVGGFHKVPQKILTENGINFVGMLEGEEMEF